MKKTFKAPVVGTAPELQFFSQETIAKVDGGEADSAEVSKGTVAPPAGYKVNPMFIETKTKRVQLVLQPSLFVKVKAAADGAGLSFNEYVHRILAASVDDSARGK